MADHPHAGGENVTPLVICLGVHGPSPRGWGERRNCGTRKSPARTIPTRVGRTPRREPARCMVPDHPHAGGENAETQCGPVVVVGPSPRGWGELPFPSLPLKRLRTIPTRVGRTSALQLVMVRRSDHPHAGGENFMAIAKIATAAGPSPRGWGELQPAAR